MPADPRYDAVHEKTRAGADARHGCWNKPRPVDGAIVTGSPAYGSQEWAFRNSTECQHSATAAATRDAWCDGCKWINVEVRGGSE